jgi:hypothetical protein
MIEVYASKGMSRLGWRIICFAVLAGALYYSWPLGYWLNPAVGQHGLASDLEATGQPYNWLFTTLDVVSGALILLVTIWLARAWRPFMNISIKFILWGYGLFGVLTATDALLPMNCLADERQCGAILHNPMVVLHGIASIGSIGALTLSIVGTWQLLAVTYKSAFRLRWLLHTIMITWFGFGLLTLGLIITAHSSNVAQHVFITICSVWTVLMPFILSHLHSQEQDLMRAISTE